MIENKEVIKWCYEGITDVTLANIKLQPKEIGSKQKLLDTANEFERMWGNKIMGTEDGGQWTTTLCQNLVEEALNKLGCKNVRKVTKKKATLRDKDYDPDLECDDYVYEVKGRSWTMTGTAGEKILGVPLKYGEVPRLYKKPLKIVLIGYQEFEARNEWQFGDLLDSNNQTQELKNALAYHKEHNIEYVGFTDILKQLGYQHGCWK
jgi:hypothetical protein